MMGPQRGNFSKDISWGDLGHAIQKACVDSSSGGGGGGADPDDDRKMPAKERPARRNTPNERFVVGGEAADPRQSMKMQMREKRDRLRQNFARSHSSGEDDVSWRDLTHSIEKAKWNSSVPDVGDLAGCDDGRTRSEPGGTMFESFKHLDAALERAMRDSLANGGGGGGECGAERRATLGGGGGAGNGATLFESFRNLDEAMAQAMKNSLMDAADGHQWDAERNVGALEPMEEGEESDNDNDNDDDGNNDVCGDVSSAADDHRTEIQNSKAKKKFTNLGSRGGGRHSMSSIASIKDTSGGNLDQIQRQLQGFSWSRDSGEDSDGAGVNSEVTPPQHRQLSLDSTSSDLDGNPPSSRPDATTSKHKRRASRNCVNSELSGNEAASQSAAGKRSSFNHRIRRRDSSGSDIQENHENQDSSQSTAVDHPEPSVKHHPCDLHYSTRKGSLSDELESAVPTPRNKKKPGRTPNALSSSLSSPSQRHPACGAGRLTSSVIISSSSALRQGQSIPRSTSDDCQSDEAACATSKTSRIHDGIHSRDGRNNLEAPPSTAPAKKKMGLKHIFGRSKSKHSS